MEGRTDLVEAAADPERRRAQALISEPRDTVVVVEGTADFRFFKSMNFLFIVIFIYYYFN